MHLQMALCTNASALAVYYSSAFFILSMVCCGLKDLYVIQSSHKNLPFNPKAKACRAL